jgi:hypothetical protein
MTYQIYNYPLNIGGPRKAKYPIRELQTGQSFSVPESEESALRAAAAYVNARFHKWGVYVTVQKINGTVWCGRVEVPTDVTVYKPRT